MIGKRPEMPTGYPGPVCRPCRGACVNQRDRFFTTLVKTFFDRTKQGSTFYRQIVRCKDCPLEVGQTG